MTDENIKAIAEKYTRSEKIVDHDLNLNNWTFKNLYGNTLWILRLDEPDANLILKNNIVLMPEQVKGLYSLGKVLMIGDTVKHAKVGEYIIFPSQGFGQSAQKTVDGYKTYFIREDAVMAVVEPIKE